MFKRATAYVLTKLKLYVYEILVILLLTGVCLPIIITNINWFSVTDGILLFTAFIIIWYTHETRIMAKATILNQTHFARPDVSFKVTTNKEYPLDIRIQLKNLSNYEILATVNCNIKANGSPIIGFYKAYTGEEYWPINFRRGSEGHFSMLVVLLRAGLISDDEYNIIGIEGLSYEKCLGILLEKYCGSLPAITMDVEIGCENELGKTRLLLPKHYDYDFYRRVWIPKLTTSTKPDWKRGISKGC